MHGGEIYLPRLSIAEKISSSEKPISSRLAVLSIFPSNVSSVFP